MKYCNCGPSEREPTGLNNDTGTVKCGNCHGIIWSES